VTAQAEYTPDIVAIDFPQSLGILAPRALDYALKIQPVHVLAIATLWSFRPGALGVHKAVRSRPNKITRY
jgi:hypothetical protein